MDANEFAESALAAQWLASWATVGGAALAGLFGVLTLMNFRLGKKNLILSEDNQERSTIAAATDSGESELSARIRESTERELPVRRTGGENYIVMNNNTVPLYDVRVEGLTELDKRRLTVTTPQPVTLEAGGVVGFVLVSRFTLSGPANLVVTYSIDPGGSHRSRKVVRVPAP